MGPLWLSRISKYPWQIHGHWSRGWKCRFWRMAKHPWRCSQIRGVARVGLWLGHHVHLPSVDSCFHGCILDVDGSPRSNRHALDHSMSQLLRGFWPLLPPQCIHSRQGHAGFREDTIVTLAGTEVADTLLAPNCGRDSIAVTGVRETCSSSGDELKPPGASGLTHGVVFEVGGQLGTAGISWGSMTLASCR